MNTEKKLKLLKWLSIIFAKLIRLVIIPRLLLVELPRSALLTIVSVPWVTLSCFEAKEWFIFLITGREARISWAFSTRCGLILLRHSAVILLMIWRLSQRGIGTATRHGDSCFTLMCFRFFLLQHFGFFIFAPFFLFLNLFFIWQGLTIIAPATGPFFITVQLFSYCVLYYFVDSSLSIHFVLLWHSLGFSRFCGLHKQPCVCLYTAMLQHLYLNNSRDNYFYQLIF